MNDKWMQLKLWVAKQHDANEKMYRETNLPTAEVISGVFRQVFQVMGDYEQLEAMAAAQAKARPATPTTPAAGTR